MRRRELVFIDDSDDERERLKERMKGREAAETKEKAKTVDVRGTSSLTLDAAAALSRRHLFRLDRRMVKTHDGRTKWRAVLTRRASSFEGHGHQLREQRRKHLPRQNHAPEQSPGPAKRGLPVAQPLPKTARWPTHIAHLRDIYSPDKVQLPSNPEYSDCGYSTPCRFDSRSNAAVTFTCTPSY
ncbi:hypothetical protein PybrP1_001268 [[Pythium] brassicae (nom. inval.)]|nr:hypothetical protein PybrP1_001268 [[Pythium] brassicae (nom. inval.)]